jgi:hypothetical protein
MSNNKGASHVWTPSYIQVTTDASHVALYNYYVEVLGLDAAT